MVKPVDDDHQQMQQSDWISVAFVKAIAMVKYGTAMPPPTSTELNAANDFRNQWASPSKETTAQHSNRHCDVNADPVLIDRMLTKNPIPNTNTKQSRFCCRFFSMNFSGPIPFKNPGFLGFICFWGTGGRLMGCSTTRFFFLPDRNLNLRFFCDFRFDFRNNHIGGFSTCCSVTTFSLRLVLPAVHAGVSVQQ